MPVKLTQTGSLPSVDALLDETVTAVSQLERTAA
jgi:hypothetical protein